MQVLSAETATHIIALDALELACEIATKLSTDEVLHVSCYDPVEVTHKMLSGKAAVMIEAVREPDRVETFRQAQQLVGRGGLIIVIGLYEEDSSSIESSLI